MAKKRIGILIMLILLIICVFNIKEKISGRALAESVAGIIIIGIGTYYEFFYLPKDNFNVDQIIDTTEIEKEAELRKNTEGLKKYAVLSKKSVLEKIKQANPNFNEYQFLSLAKNNFLKYKKAIEDGRIDDIELLCTKNFFELQKHSHNEKNKNKLKYIEVGKIKEAELRSYHIENEEEKITVFFKSIDIRNDYNVVTGEKYKGLSGKPIEIKNYVDFQRKMAKKDEKGNEIISSDCPNCGAPTHIISTGKCQYCGELIQIKDTNWRISDVRGIEKR